MSSSVELRVTGNRFKTSIRVDEASWVISKAVNDALAFDEEQHYQGQSATMALELNEQHESDVRAAITSGSFSAVALQAEDRLHNCGYDIPTAELIGVHMLVLLLCDRV